MEASATCHTTTSFSPPPAKAQPSNGTKPTQPIASIAAETSCRFQNQVFSKPIESRSIQTYLDNHVKMTHSRVIGGGSTGNTSIWLDADGESYAVKIIEKGPKMYSLLKGEFYALLFKHKNIARTHAVVFQRDNQFYLVTEKNYQEEFKKNSNITGDTSGTEPDIAAVISEFVPGKQLFPAYIPRADYLDKVIDIMIQLCEALAYLHQMGVVHCDVHSGNCLYDQETGIVKLVDFEGARYLNRGEDPDAIVAPLNYAAPEALLDREGQGKSLYSTSTDLWGAGAILIEILTENMPGDYSTTSKQFTHFKVSTVTPQVIPTVTVECVKAFANLGVANKMNVIACAAAHNFHHICRQKEFGALARLATDLTAYHPSHRPTAIETITRLKNIRATPPTEGVAAIPDWLQNKQLSEPISVGKLDTYLKKIMGMNYVHDIGSGQSGIVSEWSGPDQKKYVVKIFKHEHEFNELNALQLKHISIVRTFAMICQIDRGFYIITEDDFHNKKYGEIGFGFFKTAAVIAELVPSKNLGQLINSPDIDLEAMINISIQLCDALRYIHEQHQLIHCDVKADNVLYDKETGEIKLIDFNSSRLLHDSSPPGLRGTLTNLAPEVIHDFPGPSTDIWGVGATIMHLLTTKPPGLFDRETSTLLEIFPEEEGMHCIQKRILNFAETSFDEKVKLIMDSMEDDPDNDPPKFPDFVDIIVELLNKDPAGRPILADIITKLKQLKDMSDTEVVEKKSTKPPQGTIPPYLGLGLQQDDFKDMSPCTPTQCTDHQLNDQYQVIV
ncbi:protein kinase [Sansalvadorimonas sp. 2012CJ34-2]|uniref:Protein kinase n=1 Tax=Parendozoicomonas callyspongiae TaxID=2942213 RepID=A0ABT0PCU7_9GAMM|nr:protein kinase [Sansalvadorimonas sp. 2012CJ34-2]MCL6269174.1 protein kinase [Sansalvadorimonas sp. 2012CJ34-2]